MSPINLPIKQQIAIITLIYSELMSWVNDMKALLSADELAKDMSGAEAMLQRHRERKGEIDAQEDSFKAATQFGQSLISSGHFASEEVKKEVRKCRKVGEVNEEY